MKQLKHKVQKKIWFYPWLKWVALALFLLLLFCGFFKCCSHEKEETQQVSGGTTYIPPVRPGISVPWFPDLPNRIPPIDSSKIRISPDDPLQREIVTDRLNVYLQDTTDMRVVVAEVRGRFPGDSIYATYYAEEYKRVQLHVVSEKRKELGQKLKGDFAEVKFVVEEWIVRRSSRFKENDPGFKLPEQSWFYERIGLPDAWNDGYGDTSIVVAVIDECFDLKHTELSGQAVDPWNVFEYSDQVRAYKPDMVHGTHVAGTIVAKANNGFGISGVAPGCRFMPIQVANTSGIMTLSSILDGIFYALKNNADIINLSLGSPMQRVTGKLSPRQQQDFSSQFLLEEAAMWNEIYEIAQKEGVIIVQAAGNEALLAEMDPMKRSTNTIVVGAISSSGQVAPFSNVGSAVRVYAPGVKIYSSIPENRTGPLDGTSMASPIVAGCLALVKSKKPDISYREMIDLIRLTGTPVAGEGGVLIHIDKILATI